MNVSPSPRKMAAAAMHARSDSEVREIVENLKIHIQTIHLISPLFKFIDSLMEVCPLCNHVANI
jgi:hypothetical protein